MMNSSKKRCTKKTKFRAPFERHKTSDSNTVRELAEEFGPTEKNVKETFKIKDINS